MLIKKKADISNEAKNLYIKKENLENVSDKLAIENITNKINELVILVINLELMSTSQASQK